MPKIGSDVAAAARQALALDLRAAGASYREIGEQLNISHTAARLDIQRGLQAAQADIRRQGARLVALEILRLEIPLVALARRVRDGELGAIGMWVRLSEARLHAFEAQNLVERLERLEKLL